MAIVAIMTGLSFAAGARLKRRRFMSALNMRVRWPYCSGPRARRSQWALMGKCHLMLGHYKKATEQFQKAVALDPNKAPIRALAGPYLGTPG